MKIVHKHTNNNTRKHESEKKKKKKKKKKKGKNNSFRPASLEVWMNRKMMSDRKFISMWRSRHSPYLVLTSPSALSPLLLLPSSSLLPLPAPDVFEGRCCLRSFMDFWYSHPHESRRPTLWRRGWPPQPPVQALIRPPHSCLPSLSLIYFILNHFLCTIIEFCLYIIPILSSNFSSLPLSIFSPSSVF